MMWLTWRQHRAQVLVTAAFLALLGVFLLVHGLGTASLRTGVAHDRLGAVLGGRYLAVYTYLSWLPVVPLAIGLFWGAPVLARELERGTLRLSWTQSVPRRRWLAVKLGVLGVAVTAAGLALGAMVSAWLDTFDGTGYADRFSDPAMFGSTGVAAGAWWLFAFMLGTAAGGAVRRLLPALAVTIAVFVLVMFAIFQVREYYAEPARQAADHPDAALTFITGWAYVSPAGAEVPVPPECVDVADDRAYLGCLRDSEYQSVVYYHPNDRYWRFQWTEAGILLLAALSLAGPVAYRVARRPV